MAKGVDRNLVLWGGLAELVQTYSLKKIKSSQIPELKNW